MTDSSSASPSSVQYIERTRLFYEAQGFTAAYQYAQNKGAPFQHLDKPLGESRVGLITTASRYFREDLEPRKVDYGESQDIPERLYTDDLSWDKEATHTDDVNSFCPIETLNELQTEQVIGSLGRRFVCAPTEYSKRATVEQDAPDILAALREDEVDVALLVPL